MSNDEARFQPRRAIRFIFEYEGGQLRLVTQQAVEMVVSDTIPASLDTPGYYLDARDSRGRTLARVAAPGAFSRSTEVFPERHEEPIARIDVQRQRDGECASLPTVDQADHVTLVRVVEGAERGAGVERVRPRVVDVASFPLGRR